ITAPAHPLTQICLDRQLKTQFGPFAAMLSAVVWQKWDNVHGLAASKGNKKALFPGPFLVELAGLEPATSWVRFGRNPSPPFAMLSLLRQPGRSRRRAFATGCHRSS